MRKTKVLFCILYLAHGGTEKQLIALLDGLDRSRFEPYLCCIKQTAIDSSFREDADSLFRQIDCGKLQNDFKSFRSIQAICQILQLANYIRRRQIDIVVAYFIDPPIFSFLAAQLSLRMPRFVVAFRDLGLLRSSHSALLRFVFRHSDAFLANSLAVRDDYVKHDGLPMEKFTVIGNGLDVDQFALYRKAPRSPKVVGIVANLNRRVKRVDIFVRAAAIVAEKNSEISFVIIGEGGLKAELEALASELGVQDKVDFVGRSYNVAQSLRDIDIGVNTSETEGFANGVLEYLAAGIPVVATDSGGNREIVVESKNGFLFTVNDFEELATRLLMLIENRDLYEQLCRNAIKSVKGRFDMDLMLQRHQDFFAQLVAE
jgi:glycosyltransferase involved in cell wall biosynthesis